MTVATLSPSLQLCSESKLHLYSCTWASALTISHQHTLAPHTGHLPLSFATSPMQKTLMHNGLAQALCNFYLWCSVVVVSDHTDFADISLNRLANLQQESHSVQNKQTIGSKVATMSCRLGFPCGYSAEPHMADIQK